VIVIYTAKIMVFNMKARHASRVTQHNLRVVYAGQGNATTLVIDRYSVSPILLFQEWEETFAEATYFPVIGKITKTSQTRWAKNQ
jgi:hypothetical protein